MIRTALSSLFQLASILVLFKVSYAIASHFHKPYIPETPFDMDFYELEMVFLGIAIAISLPILNAVQNHIVKNEWLSTLLHLLWVLYIYLETKHNLSVRPYTHLLVLICIGSTVFSRFLFNYIFDKVEKRWF